MSNICFKKVTLSLLFRRINQSKIVLLVVYNKYILGNKIYFLNLLIINFLLKKIL